MLIKCPECNNDISDTALKCPHCGKQLRKPKRGFMGKIFLWFFYLFNALMLFWLVSGLNAVSKIETASKAEEIGASIGTGLGVAYVLFIWVVGDIITGFLAFMTRPKS